MTHSVIVPYRNRSRSLNSFLSTLAISDPLEIILVDLGSPQGQTEAILGQHNHHQVRHIKIEHEGMFSRSKACNIGLANTDSDLVTIWDVDCLFRFPPVESIAHWANDLKNRRMKLSWRLHLIDPPTSQMIMDEPDHFKRLDFSRYTNTVAEDFRGLPLGTSHLTISRELLLSVGGYDERFNAYGMEDHDLNMRLHHAGVETVMCHTCPLYHLTHPYEETWRTDQTDDRIRDLFLSKWEAV